ncbi:ribonuclease Y [candidate division WWE3 bacterium RBG_19FT_COMBO_53_11]|uniref:Ribonuclease Y n=1 Tax=candidate division WWE3 bacterium RBG_19FT_COMBO_53_11 TaxID=1802613 RepID=A0A1F4UIT4_UNCKA|nr:MAG: ribonuclease Y [candidate division WWE3 bacterium RBG_16_52_45]OGC44829.1 MAG: ribonuclease Y [candidate division WWE3 bacterium RBG_19FT_COMBO_53_11]
MKDNKTKDPSENPDSPDNLSVEQLKEKYLKELEKVASLSREDARKILTKELEQEMENEKARRMAEAEEQIKMATEDRARDILVSAMEHAATSYVAEFTVSVVELPSEEWKGKIIGKEGRNVRAFERATGVELDLEEAPKAVRISSFDPVRRHIARLSLERLIREDRFQPESIESTVEKVKGEIDQEIKREGESIALEAGLGGLPAGIIELLGRFKFRTSYGQNLAKHSLEMVKLAGYLAAEVGADVELTKAAALFHDIGKVATSESGEPHDVLTRKILERFGFPEKLVNAAASHHDREEKKSVEAELVYIADAISGSRPGARYEDIEGYVKRITDLEKIAKDFSGVEDAYAISAGRELRVIVKAGEISDERAAQLAQEVGKRVKEQMVTPGGVKVVVIRESRFESQV